MIINLSDEERFLILNKFYWHPDDDDHREDALIKRLRKPQETWQIHAGGWVKCKKGCRKARHVHIGDDVESK